VLLRRLLINYEDMRTRIRPQDLRIGNIVGVTEEFRRDLKRENKNPLFRVTMIEDYCVGADYVDSRYDMVRLLYTELLPVLLTPELLRGCGFTYSESRDSYLHNAQGVELLIVDEEYHHGAWVTVDDMMIAPSLHCRYLHELQNLFFATTSKELEVKL